VRKLLLRLAAVSLMMASSLALGQQAPAPAAPAQQEKKPLTNADVVKLVQAGLGDDTILLAIQNSNTNFDTSPEALIDLKAKGVSPAVLNAVLKAGTASHSPTAPAAAAPASSNPEGRALMAKVVETFGGAQRLAALQGTRYKGTRQLKMPMGEVSLQVEQVIVYPDRMVLTSILPNAQSRMVVSPEAAFSTLPNGVKQALPQSAKDDVLRTIKLSPLYVAQHAEDPGYSFVARGTEKVGDVDTTVLEISSGGAQTRWNVADNGRLVRATRTVAGPAGPVQDTVDFADWRPTDGLLLPFRVTESGAATLVTVWSEFTANPTLDASLFDSSGARPANPQLKPRSEASPREQVGGECPLEITKVDPRSYPFGTTGPCCQLQIKFRNTGNKTIVAAKFGADFLDATNDRHESAWNYTSDDVVRPGEKKGPHWEDIVYFEEFGYSIKAEAWLQKALFSDGTSWQDDGSKSCKGVSWEKEKK
jgi:hypothetical protein